MVARRADLAMIMFRMAKHAGSPEHIAIAWNLLLPWIPLALALIVYRPRVDRASGPLRWPPWGSSLAAVPSRTLRTS